MKWRLTSGRNRGRGFTLVEIMVVVVIIGILAAIAVPAIKRVQQRARCTAFINDLRVFSETYQRYCNENGNFPAESGTGGLAQIRSELPDLILLDVVMPGRTLREPKSWTSSEDGPIVVDPAGTGGNAGPSGT